MKYVLYLLLVSIFLLSACTNGKTQSLEAFYRDAEIENIDQIIIQDGTTGYMKTITEQAQMDEFLALINEIEFSPQDNQEKREGWRYGITLFDGEKEFAFTLNQINDIYYDANPDIYPIVDSYYKQLPDQDNPIFLSTDYTNEDYHKFALAYTFMNLWNEELSIIRHPLFPGWNVAGNPELEPVEYFMQTAYQEYYYSRDIAEKVENHAIYQLPTTDAIAQFLKSQKIAYSRSDYLKTIFTAKASDSKKSFTIEIPKRGPEQQANAIKLSAYYANKEMLYQLLSYLGAPEAIVWSEAKAKILYNPLYMHQDLQSGYFAKRFGDYLIQFNVTYNGQLDMQQKLIGGQAIFNDKMKYHMTITTADQLKVIENVPVKPIEFKRETLNQFLDDVMRSYKLELSE